jgi:hypothetical protein
MSGRCQERSLLWGIKFNILPLASQYLFSLLPFTAHNMQKFEIHSELHTRHKHDLHMTNANLTSYQESVCCTGTNLCSALTPSITALTYNMQLFKPTLKDYLLVHSTSTELFPIESSKVVCILLSDCYILVC